MRCGTLYDKRDPVAGNVHARERFYDLVYLRNNDPGLERGGLDDDRRVFGVWPRVEISTGIRCLRRDKRYGGCQIHEITAEQLEISMDGADRDALLRYQLREPCTLWPRKGEVEFGRDALL